MEQQPEAKPVRLTMMRRTIAKRMKESWETSPSVTYQIPVDATSMIEFRKKTNQDQQIASVKLSYNHIMMKAVATILSDMKELNASITDKELLLHPHVNIGLAVAVKNGLLVPNVKNCEEKGLWQIAKEAQEKINAALEGRLDPQDLQNATFTVTNLGAYGITSFTPIINQPEVAILGMCAMVKTPVEIENKTEFRPLMNLCLTADHRAIDGVVAAEFLQKLKELLENPAVLETLL